ncbi:MAG: hypothetical protein R2780_11495 [Crocinitomicaceae bacterium]|nr:hypothetical protein [Crocinitomicaceae bacterium]
MKLVSSTSFLKILLTCLWLGTLAPAFCQKEKHRFQTTKHEESEIFLYQNIESLNNFKTIFSSVFEIDLDRSTISHRRGSYLVEKKPWVDVTFELNVDEMNIINGYIEKVKDTENCNKYFDSVRFRPINTIYFVTPACEVFIQWEGPNPPNKKIIHQLLKLHDQLLNFVNNKRTV